LHSIDETHPSKLNQRSALPGKHTLFTGVSLRALPRSTVQLIVA